MNLVGVVNPEVGATRSPIGFLALNGSLRRNWAKQAVWLPVVMIGRKFDLSAVIAQFEGSFLK